MTCHPHVPSPKPASPLLPHHNTQSPRHAPSHPTHLEVEAAQPDAEAVHLPRGLLVLVGPEVGLQPLLRPAHRPQADVLQLGGLVPKVDAGGPQPEVGGAAHILVPAQGHALLARREV